MANEFKIKNGLLLGVPSTSQPVTSIKDTSISITSDASSLLATGKAIYDYFYSEISPISTSIDNLDSSVSQNWGRWIDSNRTGFLNQTDTSLSFNDSTYVFTLGDEGSGWSYYRDGIKWNITGDSSIRLTPSGTPATDTYYITIDSSNGSLTVDTTPWSLDGTELLVAYVQFDSANTPTYIIGEERHSMLIDRRIHKYLHETRGSQYISGGGLTGPDVAAGDTGVTDASNAVGIGATEIADEDIFQTLPELVRPDGSTPSYFTFLRNSGNLDDWAVEDIPFPVDAGNIQYDNGTGMTAATDGKYVNSYIMFTNLSGPSGNPQFAILPGQAEFDNVDSAIDENPASFDFTGLPIAEYVIAWQLTWEVSTGYSTTGSVALASSPKRIQVNATTATSVTTESHNDLIGLQGGNASERYHLDLSQYNDYVRKSYVDSSLNGKQDNLNFESQSQIPYVNSTTDDFNYDSSFLRTENNLQVDALNVNYSPTGQGFGPAISINYDNSLFLYADPLFTQLTHINASSRIVIQSNERMDIYGDRISLRDGSIYFTNIEEETQSKVIYFNPSTKKIFYGDPCTGGETTQYWSLDGSILSPTDDTVNVQLSSIQISTDAGTVAVIDMDVSSATAGLEQSYAFSIDENPIAKVYAEGNGSGGIQESAFKVLETLYAESSVYFTSLPDVSTSYVLFYDPASDEVTYSSQSSISGVTQLSALSDVSVGGTIPDGSVLVFDSAASKWTYGAQITSVDWGDIEGTITNQTDLWTILNDLSTNKLGTSGNQILDGSLNITGNLTIDGSTTIINTTNLDVSDNIIYINTGMSGSPPVTMVSGMKVDRGSENPYFFIFAEDTDTFRIGTEATEEALPGDTQAVATREDVPEDGGVAFWNDTEKRFDTSVNFTTDGANVYLPGLQEVSTGQIIYYNVASGLLTYADASTTGGGSSYWELDGSTLVPTDPTVDVKLGKIEIDEDAGAVTLSDMPVSSTPTAGTEESYSFDIDGSTVAKVWGEADGNGALQETGFVVETAQYMGDPNTNGSWRFYPDSNGDLVFEKRIAGTWTEKGKFTE